MVWRTTRPTAVVRGIDDECVVIEIVLFQRIKNAADIMVQLLNGVAVFAPIGFALEGLTDAQWVVQHGVRQVEKEGLLLVGADEFHGLIGIQAGEFGRVGRTLDNFAIADQRHAALFLEVNDLHRIQIVQQAVIMIEALIAWQKRLLKAEVPFADASRGVAIGFE